MNLITTAKQTNIQLTEKFQSQLECLAPLYDEIVDNTKKQMVFVAQLAGYRNAYSTGSPEREFYDSVLDGLGINKDKRSDYTIAYNFYNKLVEKGVEFAQVADDSTPYQLLELKRCQQERSDALFDVAKYYQRNNKVPPVKLLRDYRNGKVGSSFKPIPVLEKTGRPEFDAQIPERSGVSEPHTVVDQVMPSVTTNQPEPFVVSQPEQVSPVSPPTANECRKERTLDDYTYYELGVAFLKKVKEESAISKSGDDMIGALLRELPQARRRGFDHRTNGASKALSPFGAAKAGESNS